MTKVQILHVPDCPDTPTLAARLDEVVADRVDVTVEQRVVHDHDEAVALGMTGSPTLLLDGLDPFATPGQVASLSCRAMTDLPSAAQLRSALAGATPLELAAWQAGSTGARQAVLPGRLRELHQAVLAHFLDTGDAPTRTWLTGQAGELGLDPGAAVARLAADDLVHLGDERVAVAYPFSGVPSGHRVEVADGPAVWAMCAIDALGIPQLAGRDATISATDPSSGEPVRVEALGGTWRWTPPGTVVLVAGTVADGPSVTCTCGHVNFYTRRAPAQAYLDAHPELTGRVLDQQTAIELAGAVFGALLGDRSRAA